MRVLVTGASGFVGSALVERLGTDGRWNVRAGSRRSERGTAGNVEWVVSPELEEHAQWGDVLEGVDTVVHLAGRVHVMTRGGPASDAEFHRVNTKGTLRLAEQAVKAGVRRLLFLSSIKVHGECGTFDERSVPTPTEPYGESKWAAEQALRALGRQTGLEVVVIRPPLVYGPGVKANFRALLTAVCLGVPLPLGGIRNSRSLVGVSNLVDLIVTCVDHPAAKDETFLVSDGQDLSTPDLVRLIARAAGRRARLVSVPTVWLQAAGRLTGRVSAVERLVGSLTVDISKARRLLDWSPPFPAEGEVLRAVQHR